MVITSQEIFFFCSSACFPSHAKDHHSRAFALQLFQHYSYAVQPWNIQRFHAAGIAGRRDGRIDGQAGDIGDLETSGDFFQMAFAEYVMLPAACVAFEIAHVLDYISL